MNFVFGSAFHINVHSKHINVFASEDLLFFSLLQPGVLANQHNLLGYAVRQDIIGGYMYDVFRVEKVLSVLIIRT